MQVQIKSDWDSEIRINSAAAYRQTLSALASSINNAMVHEAECTPKHRRTEIRDD
jgi:hypothetical protein